MTVDDVTCGSIVSRINTGMTLPLLSRIRRAGVRKILDQTRRAGHDRRVSIFQTGKQRNTPVGAGDFHGE